MKAKTTKDLKDSNGNHVPAGTEISVEKMPKGPEQVVAARVPYAWSKRFVAVDEWSVERPGRRTS
jgi:hypothetical protein